MAIITRDAVVGAGPYQNAHISRQHHSTNTISPVAQVRMPSGLRSREVGVKLARYPSVLAERPTGSRSVENQNRVS